MKFSNKMFNKIIDFAIKIKKLNYFFMERIVFTEKSEDFLNTLISEGNHDVFNTLETSLDKQENLKKQIAVKISSITTELNRANPIDEYKNKILDLASISSNPNALQTFLAPKTLEENLLPYMKKKIDHITKIIVNSKKEKEKNENSKAQNNNEDRYVSSMKPKSPKNENLHVLQRKCNTILYSENYLERLAQRYKNYLDRNQTIKFHLNKQSSSPKLTFSGKTTDLQFNEAQIEEKNNLLGFQTKYNLRYRSRIKDYHKKKYIHVWTKNNLPPIGIKENINILRQQRLENQKNIPKK